MFLQTPVPHLCSAPHDAVNSSQPFNPFFKDGRFWCQIRPKSFLVPAVPDDVIPATARTEQAVGPLDSPEQISCSCHIGKQCQQEQQGDRVSFVFAFCYAPRGCGGSTPTDLFRLCLPGIGLHLPPTFDRWAVPKHHAGRPQHLRDRSPGQGRVPGWRSAHWQPPLSRCPRRLSQAPACAASRARLSSPVLPGSSR